MGGTVSKAGDIFAKPVDWAGDLLRGVGGATGINEFSSIGKGIQDLPTWAKALPTMVAGGYYAAPYLMGSSAAGIPAGAIEAAKMAGMEAGREASMTIGVPELVGAVGAGSAAGAALNTGAASPAATVAPGAAPGMGWKIPAAMIGANVVTSALGAQAAEDQARELYQSRFPNSAAITAAGNIGQATNAQNLLLAKKRLEENLAARGMGGGYAASQFAGLERAGMKNNADLALQLTQFANTPNSPGITPWKTWEQQIAELAGATTGTIGGLSTYGYLKNNYPSWF